MGMDLGYGFADLDRVQIRTDAHKEVPTAWVRERRAIPVKRDGNILCVAIEQPSEEKLNELTHFGAMTGFKVVPVLAMPQALDTAIERYCPEAESG